MMTNIVDIPEWIRAAADAAPPLTAEQIAVIRAAFRAGSDSDTSTTQHQAQAA